MNEGLRDALTGFLEQPDDVVEGALIVSRIVAEDADVDWARAEIADIAATVRAEHPDPSPTDVIGALAKLGFQGAGERYYEIENSVLPHVLRTRRGIPISLGVVLMGVAGQLRLEALGVSFPRHFLVTVGDLLTDPYKMAPTSVQACRAWLKQNGVAEDGAFNIASAQDIVLRMLNNVRMTLQNKGDFVCALDISDYQLLIVPDAYGLYIERADAWLRLGAPEMVVDELEKAAVHAPDGDVKKRLEERISHARRTKSVVN